METRGCSRGAKRCWRGASSCRLPHARLQAAGCSKLGSQVVDRSTHGCRLQVAGCRLQAAGCSKLGRRLWAAAHLDAGCGLRAAGCRLQAAGCRLPHARLQDAGCRLHAAGCRLPHARLHDAGCRLQAAGCRTHGCRLQPASRAGSPIGTWSAGSAPARRAAEGARLARGTQQSKVAGSGQRAVGSGQWAVGSRVRSRQWAVTQGRRVL